MDTSGRVHRKRVISQPKTSFLNHTFWMNKALRRLFKTSSGCLLSESHHSFTFRRVFSQERKSAMNNSIWCHKFGMPSVPYVNIRWSFAFIWILAVNAWSGKGNRSTNKLFKSRTCYKLLINHKRQRDGDRHPGCRIFVSPPFWGEIPLSAMNSGSLLSKMAQVQNRGGKIVNSKQVISAAIVGIWNVIFESPVHRLALTEGKVAGIPKHAAYLNSPYV